MGPGYLEGSDTIEEPISVVFHSVAVGPPLILREHVHHCYLFRVRLPIHVDAHSGYRGNERPVRFTLEDGIYDIRKIEDRWRDPNAEYFRVRSAEGKRYILRCDGQSGHWTLERGFDGDALLARPGIVVILVGSNAIQQAVAQLAGCQSCSEDAGFPFDWILGQVLDRRGPYEFVLPEPVTCPVCGSTINEKTLVDRETQ